MFQLLSCKHQNGNICSRFALSLSGAREEHVRSLLQFVTKAVIHVVESGAIWVLRIAGKKAVHGVSLLSI